MDIGSTQSARLRLALVMGLALALAACGGGGTSSSTPNPVPRLDSISPSSTTAGGGLFTLTANGANFISGSVIRWGGASRTTTFVSSSQLTATISAADIAAASTVEVTVFNPAPGGGSSAVQTFSIENPVPTLNSFSPIGAVAGSPALTLTVTGMSFVSTSVVRWNGNDRSTSFVSGIQLTASIPASDLATTGTAQVSVFNPTPGGGLSGSLGFGITAETPLALDTSRLPDTTSGKSYYFILSASGGVPNPNDASRPYNWTVSSGNLPAGLTLDPATGQILGTVSGSTSTFTVRVSDFATPANNVTRSLTIQVLPSLGGNDFCNAGNIAGTTQISNGKIRASLSPYGDVDVYSFQGTVAHVVAIRTFAQDLDLDGNPSTRDSQADTILELLNSNCSLLYFNDDLATQPHNQDSQIFYSLPLTGLYFIRVREFRGDGRPDLIYDLSLSGAE